MTERVIFIKIKNGSLLIIQSRDRISITWQNGGDTYQTI